MNSKNDSVLPIRIRVRFQDSDSPGKNHEE